MAYGEERKKVIKRLGKIAFEKPNDAVKLAFFRDENDLREIEDLDLTMLSEVKRDKNGAVGVKLIDRLMVAKMVLEELRAESEAETSDMFLNIMGEAERE